MIRVLIVDDHEVVRRELHSLLSSTNAIEICGQAVDGRDAITKAKELLPDVITMDISMPNLNGLEATREIRRLLPNMRILILSQHDSPEMMRQALDAGASGYVMKSAISTQLVSALEKVQRGEVSFEGAVFGGTQSNLDPKEIFQRSAILNKELHENERETHDVPLPNPDRTALHFGVTRDITERTRSEQALAEKARLLDLSNDAILVRDSADRITFWNQGATEIYGFSREEALGRVSHELFRTVFPEPLERIRGRLYREGRWAGELQHIRKDGSRIIVSTRWSLLRDSQGNVVSILETNRDISSLKRAEQAQARLAAIVESSEDAIVSKDLNGVITSWNAGAERIFGFSPEEAVGKSITLIIPPELQDEEKEILRRLRAGERIDHFETIRRTKDGARRHISLTISPLRDAAGRVIGASKIARDITERKQIEQILKEAELSGRLLQLQDEERRRVARELHDGVGQLLAALSMNMGQLMHEKRKLSADAARSLQENVSLTDQAIAEIRTLSHLLHPPLLDEIGLKSALTEYVQGFGERSNIRVTLDLPPDLERLPQDYELSLFRIVQECLTNIHRHSGSQTAHVNLSRVPGEIQLEVTDQGRGIPAGIQEKFVAGQSTGVGLRGMRERVRQIGGALQIRSDQNGTSVLVILPTPHSTVSASEDESPAATDSGSPAKPAPTKPAMMRSHIM